MELFLYSLGRFFCFRYPRTFFTFDFSSRVSVKSFHVRICQWCKKKICKKTWNTSDKCLSQKFPQGNRNVIIEIKAKKNCVKLRERSKAFVNLQFKRGFAIWADLIPVTVLFAWNAVNWMSFPPLMWVKCSVILDTTVSIQSLLVQYIIRVKNFANS